MRWAVRASRLPPLYFCNIPRRYSKAQQMVMYFHDILGPRVPACDFTNMNALTGCCDNYTLAVLRHLNVVSLNEELSSKIDARHDFRAGSETEVPACLRVALSPFRQLIMHPAGGVAHGGSGRHPCAV